MRFGRTIGVSGIDIKGLDHLVLTVASIEASVEFYRRVLGMQAITFGEGRRALAFGRQKINLHELGREFEPKALRPAAGSADLCFVVGTSITAALAHLEACGVPLIEGPVRRTGACGPILSIYFRDPDGNLIELGEYTA